MRPVNEQVLAVVYGGYTSEVEISVKSGKSVARWLRNAGRNVYEVLLSLGGWWAITPSGDGTERKWPIDRNDFSFTPDGGEKICFDKVFIIIHGDPGENGCLQAYFEMLSIAYVGCSSQCATIAFDKYACKSYLRDSGTFLARDIMLRRNEPYRPEDIIARTGLPAFVKPCGGGSSFGVTKIRSTEELDGALRTAFSESDTVIIEQCLYGREIDCAVYEDSLGPHALPLIEIIPRNEFFDYDAKYNGASSELCPAPLPAEDRTVIQNEAVRIFRRLGCKGLVRMDFIYGPDNRPYFLEVNPNPGMTESSLVPQMVRAAGMTMEDFLTGLIDRAGED